MYLGRWFVVVIILIADINAGPPKWNRFSTKTSYNASLGTDQFWNPVYEDGESNLKDCRPVQVIGLFRHGTRYPGEKDLMNIERILDRMRTSGGNKDLVDALQAVKSHFPIHVAKGLAPSGEEELRSLGERFASRYANLFATTNRADIDFYVSHKSRAIDSCTWFQNGFYHPDHSASNRVFPDRRDDLLRFFDGCPAYMKSVAHNGSAMWESQQYKRQAFPELCRRLSQRLGNPELNISVGEMKSIYVMAGSEVAILGTSVWYQLLADEDFDILEYAADVKNYWKKGYGHRLNYEQSCPLVKHIFSIMDNMVKDKQAVKAAFYFGHTETMIPLMTLLGLFRDASPLLADNQQQHAQRLFRTSRVAPFATNIALVLHECDVPRDTAVSDESKPTRRTEHRLELLFKETPLRWPFCAGSTCAYNVVRDQFSDWIDHCNFNEMCDLDTTGAKNMTATGLHHNEL